MLWMRYEHFGGIEEAASQLPSPDFFRLLEDLQDLAIARVALPVPTSGCPLVFWSSDPFPTPQLRIAQCGLQAEEFAALTTVNR
jgi:hypothetical protein